MPEATNNLLPPAASPQAITLARYYAKRAVKAAWIKQGLKPQCLDASDLTKAAKAYLSEHRAELFDEAERTLAEWSNSSTITNTPRSSHPPTQGRSNHDRHHANHSKSNTTKEIA
jgi:hypothetical protein